MQVRFWGTRGSIAAPGPATVRYGGNTACVELRTAAGELFIFDSGTGIRELGLALMAAGGPVRGYILLSHTHWDHIQGFPFFAPAFVAGNEFTICAGRDLDRDLESVLAGQMEYAYFPVRLAELAATVHFRDLDEGEYCLGSARVRVQYLNHTSLTMGYRVHADDRVLVYATDNEPHDRTLRPLDTLGRATPPWPVHGGDRRFVEFIRGADLLITDAQYLAEEFPQRIGWGHSTVEHAVDFAVAAGVRRLVLFHHDPTRSDAALDAVVARARGRAARQGSALEVLAAAEGLALAV
ncbi:MAG TPA: MBL fold metallo-hydrolase [Chloroflexota bacterium]|nr:MBL fold metallo-hydrolase [Chloroflexota bacterium]